MRTVLRHFVEAEGTFFAITSYAVQRARAQDGRPLALSDEGWDAFWAAFKKWFEDLAEVFAQMPLLGHLIAEFLKFVGAANVWFCGAIIFGLMILGIYAVRR